MSSEDTESEILAQQVILAATKHDVEELRRLLRLAPASVQDAETGTTPLHAAIAACEDDEAETNGESQANGQAAAKAAELEAASATVKLLLQNGAIWNDLDAGDETPGCIAFRLGLTGLYEIMVDAGVRAEMLLNRMDEYEALGDDDDDDDADETTEAEGAGDRAAVAPAPRALANASYLQSRLSVEGDRILDEDGNGVMMEWERGIMQKSAELLLPQEGLRVLNIGHGMGIIDGYFQSHNPASHHIVEAHPSILAQLRSGGWYDKANVTIHEGRWQEVLPKLLMENAMFDAIYFDTFAEDYKALRHFFSEFVIGLLDGQGGADGQGGRWGFFNGMGADRQICYDVYSKLVEMDLFEAGFDADWEEVAVPDLEGDETWKGVRRKYWIPKSYRLPTCRFIE